LKDFTIEISKGEKATNSQIFIIQIAPKVPLKNKPLLEKF